MIREIWLRVKKKDMKIRVEENNVEMEETTDKQLFQNY